jgi:ClpP class serine protease
MKFKRILESVYSKPWNITPGGYNAVKRLVEARVFANGDMPDVAGMMQSGRCEMEIDGQGIAHIDVTGTLVRHASPLEACCGAYSYEWLEEDIENALEAGVRGVWIEFDSPGGACEGNSECADVIQELAKQVPVVAYSDSQCCSAAYNLASSCSRIYGSVGSIWGSISTIIPWVDESAMWTAEGMKWDPITNTEGVLKGAGMGPSLTAAQRASLQQLVQDSFELFRANVTRNRMVPDEAMTGAAYVAPRAIGYKLIDKILTESLAYEELLAMI